MASRSCRFDRTPLYRWSLGVAKALQCFEYKMPNTEHQASISLLLSSPSSLLRVLLQLETHVCNIVVLLCDYLLIPVPCVQNPTVFRSSSGHAGPSPTLNPFTVQGTWPRPRSQRRRGPQSSSSTCSEVAVQARVSWLCADTRKSQGHGQKVSSEVQRAADEDGTL